MSLSPLSSYAQSLPGASAPVDAARGTPAAAVRSNPPAAAVAPEAKVAPTTPISANTQSVKDAALNKAVDAINRFINPVASSIQFSVDEDSGRTLVKVVDTDTNTVLRQFPSKEALAISHELDKLQGLLVKEKA
jgi:flagellar protein FlaG